MKENDKILITGAAGFIGFHLAQKLLEQGITVIGFDNLNDYYSVELKQMRLQLLKDYPRFTFIKGDLADEKRVECVIKEHRPNIIVNLAAQAGVRYSIENPRSYINSNIIGFFNLLEACRNYPIDHLVFASSSSVYGNQTKVPFSLEDNVDRPISLYAATKKCDELMAFTYAHLFHIPATGLRFFTVYGPFGRPDMAYYSFSEKIISGEKIKVFNYGDLQRDFTYIDDIIHALEKILYKIPDKDENGDRFKVYNIGNSKPEDLMYFIGQLETELGRKANIEFLPMQAGDVYQTYADVSELEKDFGFRPQTSLSDGLHNFVQWYKDYKNKS